MKDQENFLETLIYNSKNTLQSARIVKLVTKKWDEDQSNWKV